MGRVSILVLANASNLFDVSVKNTGEENKGIPRGIFRVLKKREKGEKTFQIWGSSLNGTYSVSY